MYQVIRQRQRGDADHGAIDVLEVPLDELESRARDRRIYDVSEFCRGETFRDAGYVLDANRRLILRSF